MNVKAEPRVVGKEIPPCRPPPGVPCWEGISAGLSELMSAENNVLGFSEELNSSAA